MPSPVKSKISPQTNKEAKWAPFSLWVGVVPGAVGDIPASIPGVHFLEEVTSHEVGIAAILVGGILVVQEARVGLIIDTKTLKALLQPVVLAALLAQVHLALPTPGKQNFDGLRGQGFQRTEELELVEGVPEIDRSALRRTQGVLDLAAEMVGEKDSIALADPLLLVQPVVGQLCLGVHPALGRTQIPHYHGEAVEARALDQLPLSHWPNLIIRMTFELVAVPIKFGAAEHAACEVLVAFVACVPLALRPLKIRNARIGAATRVQTVLPGPGAIVRWRHPWLLVVHRVQHVQHVRLLCDAH